MNKKNEFGYNYEDCGEDGPIFTVQTVFDVDDVNWVAEEIAEDYFSNHDGWESDWPVTFEIFKDDQSLGKWEVYLESVPSFSATRVSLGPENE